MDNHPIFCSKCRTKTDNIKGSGVVVKRNNRYYGSACCQKCATKKGSPVGKGLIDLWLSEGAKRNHPELHLIQQPDEGGTPRKSSFAGPFTRLDKRLENFNPKTGEYDSVITPPINTLDAQAMLHDIDYTINPDNKEARNKSDDDLIRVAEEVASNPNTTNINRLNAIAVAKLFRYKRRMGMGMN